MEIAKTHLTWNLFYWSALIVLGHFIAVLWHLFLVVKVQPSFPSVAIPLLILFNLLPVAGLLVIPKGFPKLAGSMVALPLATALVVGVYQHFLSSGTDNVFAMPSVAFRVPFQISAVLLVILEALGVWLGLRIFASGKYTR